MGTIIYCRISDDRAGTSAGVQRQETDCRALAAQRGWDSIDVLVDNDLSAYSGRPRPAYKQLLEQIRAGTATSVIAWHPDRLHRSPKELEEFIDLVEAHRVQVATVLAGTYDLTTATGRMTARIVGATARYESELKSERTKRALRALAEQGVPVSGTRPFGWLDDRATLDPHEAPILRDIADRILAGDTLWAITRDLQERGVRPSRGGRWTHHAVHRCITNPRIAGFRTHCGEIVGPGKWEPILDELTWRRVVRVLDERATPGPRRARSYLLSGFLRCGLCDAKLVSRSGRERAGTYVCSSHPNHGGCGKIKIHAAHLEAEIGAQILAVIDTPEFQARVNARGRDDRELELVNDIEQLEHRLDQAANDYYVEAVISRAQLTATSRTLNARLDTARRDLHARQARHRYAGLTELTAGSWESIPFDRRRAAIAELIEVITIQPATLTRRWDPRRAHVQWRI